MVKNNCRSIQYWLDTLQKQLGLFLPESNQQGLQKACKIYDCGQTAFRCGAEILLIGSDFLDLSIRLCLDVLRERDLFVNKLPDALNSKLIGYVNSLRRNCYKLSQRHVWLEVDTSKGVIETCGLFVYMIDNILFRLALDFLADERREQVNIFLGKYPSFRRDILYLGLMYSRKDTPLKLVSKIRPDDFDTKIEVMENIAGKVLPQDIKNVIKKLYDDRHVGCSAAIDIMPDGTISDVVGLEIVFRENIIENLRKQIFGPDITQLWNVLLKYGLIDERYKKLQSVIFAKNIVVDERESRIISFLSHIKLRWNKDEILPVKVYIGSDFC